MRRASQVRPSENLIKLARPEIDISMRVRPACVAFMNRHDTGAAFTLIELLIVVGIIAILALVALPNMLEAQVRAKVARAKADLRTIATTMEAYSVDHNRYPPNYDTGLYGFDPNNESFSYAAMTTPVAYMSSIPLDIFRPMEDADIIRGRYFTYIGIDTISAQPNNYPAGATEYWETHGVRWWAGSLGPDLKNDVLGHYLQVPPTRIYEPTNGTISLGDFGRTNLGPLG
ncbi:MAG: type IV pilin protein [Candidatus Sumerlaeaceae bacterium]